VEEQRGCSTMLNTVAMQAKRGLRVEILGHNSKTARPV